MSAPVPHQTNRGVRLAVLAALGLAGLALLVHVGVALAARHSLTQVESIVAIHARSLAFGDGLYYDLNSYPYTVSPYGPIFYGASAALLRAGVAAPLGGRLLSIAALLATLWLCSRLLRRWGVGELERLAGLALLASAGVIGVWGVVGQSAMPALAFSVAALERHARHEADRRGRTLAAAGLCIALAIFTKQSFLAAGFAVVGALLLRDVRRGLVFTASLAACGAATAWGLNAATDGGYLSNAVLANLNPFAWSKLADHLRYFALATGALALTAVSGFARRNAFPLALRLYLAAAVGLWLLTASKVGSDLNYQLEPTLALCLAAACSLDRLRFFDLLARRDPGWVTLLQIPLLLHLVLNAGIAVQSGMTRMAREQLARRQAAELAPWLAPERGRLLSVEIDPLLQTGRPLEVEPLIYTLLVGAGLTDPAPVTRDLEAGAFAAVILYHDVHTPDAFAAGMETPSLPAEQFEVLRRRYRLTAHIAGPLLNGVYVHEPVATPEAESHLLRNRAMTQASSRWSALQAQPYAGMRR